MTPITMQYSIKLNFSLTEPELKQNYQNIKQNKSRSLILHDSNLSNSWFHKANLSSKISSTLLPKYWWSIHMWYCQNNHTVGAQIRYRELIQQYIRHLIRKSFFIIHSYHASRTWIVYINTQYFTNIFLHLFIYIVVMIYIHRAEQKRRVCWRYFEYLTYYKCVRYVEGIDKVVEQYKFAFTRLFLLLVDKERSITAIIPKRKLIQSNIAKQSILLHTTRIGVESQS